MDEYIKKSTVLEEINKRLKKYAALLRDNKLDAIYGSKCTELVSLFGYIDKLKGEEVDLETAVHGRIDYPLIGHDFPNIYPNYKELKYYCDKNGIKDEDKIRIIIIKDDIL